MTTNAPSQPAAEARRLRYWIVQMNLAADNIVPSLVFDYEAWGFLHDTVDAMTTPCTSQDIPLQDTAYYSNLAVALTSHHDAVQQHIITAIGINPRAIYVRDQLIKASYAAARIGNLLSKLQLIQYHHIITQPHTKQDLQHA